MTLATDAVVRRIQVDSERFDRWAKLLALRMSRRTAVAGLGAATVASLTSPQWVLGQDDDDDQNGDAGGGDDTNGNEGGGDRQDGNTGGDVGFEVCQDITQCGLYHCIEGDDGWADCHFDNIGPIPGGPYPQEWVWDVPPCAPIGHTMDELEALCNAAYPGKDCIHCCSRSDVGDNVCSACADFSIAFCH